MGKIYVTDNFLAYHAKMLVVEKVLVVPLKYVTSIERSKSYVIPNLFEVQTNKGLTHNFSFLGKRDLFQRLVKHWEAIYQTQKDLQAVLSACDLFELTANWMLQMLQRNFDKENSNPMLRLSDPLSSLSPSETPGSAEVEGFDYFGFRLGSEEMEAFLKYKIVRERVVSAQEAAWSKFLEKNKCISKNCFIFCES